MLLAFSLVQKKWFQSCCTGLSCDAADGSVILTPLQGTGLPPSHVQSTSSKHPKRPHVHTGFLIAYQSIAQVLLDIVGLQINMYPMYAVVMTGHSLGGAVASIASIAIRNTYPAATARLYTIG
ncbi:hypothetical protein F5J12DRAFT_800047, partial [Pisolithus orientalis]|uniref:uncharacterized protein n=1 Tax=Pisolithus orientalis TaxID=936130 RepID=UPI0022245B8B